MKKDALSKNDSSYEVLQTDAAQNIIQIMSEIPGIIVSSVANIDYAIDETLSKIGTLLGASRVYVMLDEKDGRYLRNTYEWVDEKSGHCMFSWPLYDYEYDLPSLKKSLAEQPIIHGNVQDMAPDIQAVMIKQRITSIAITALLKDKEKIGLVGIDFCDKEREWNVQHGVLLRFLASIIALALERKQYQTMRGKLNTIRECIVEVEPIIAGHKDSAKLEPRPAKPITLLDAERRIIIETLELYHGNKLKTAKHLGLTWPSLDRRCKKLGIEAKRK